MAVKMARCMLDGAGVTAAEVAELRDSAKAEESRWHAVGPIVDPTGYMKADPDGYVRVYKRLQLAEIALASETFGPEPVTVGGD
jgi:hypothetical protein